MYEELIVTALSFLIKMAKLTDGITAQFSLKLIIN